MLPAHSLKRQAISRSNLLLYKAARACMVRVSKAFDRMHQVQKAPRCELERRVAYWTSSQLFRVHTYLFGVAWHAFERHSKARS